MEPKLVGTAVNYNFNSWVFRRSEPSCDVSANIACLLQDLHLSPGLNFLHMPQNVCFQDFPGWTGKTGSVPVQCKRLELIAE